MYLKPISALLATSLLLSCGDDGVTTPTPAVNEVPESIILKNGSVLIANSNDDDVSSLTYEWRLGNQVLGSGNELNVNNLGLADGTYSIILITTDVQGETDSISQLVTISNLDTDTQTNINTAPFSSIIQNGDILIANSADDAGVSGLTYQWMLGANPIGIDKELDTSTLGLAAGNHSITLITTDAQGESDSASVTVIVEASVGNVAPVAVAQANVYSVVAPYSINFDGRGSMDANNNIQSYEWSFAGQDTYFSQGLLASYRFETAGIYEVILTVTDSTNLKGEDSVTIEVLSPNTDSAPSAVAKANVAIGDAPLTVQLNASDSTDDVSIAEVEWSIDGLVISNDSIFSYMFAQAGNYTLTLKVTDSNDQIDTDEITIVATADSVDLDPTASFTSSIITGDAPLSVSFDASESVDDNAIDSYEWDFDNDGLIDAVGITASYIFNQEGNYTVVLTVTDSGNNSVTDQQIITVNEVIQPLAPTANFTYNVTNLMVTFDANDSEDPDMQGLDYEWEFYDESSQLVGTDSGVSSTYTFANSGLVTVKLTVTSQAAIDDETTQSFNVTAPIVVLPDDESYTLVSNSANYDVYSINKCGENTEINNSNYQFVDGSVLTVGGWNHTTNGQYSGGFYGNGLTELSRSDATEYNISSSYSGADSSCNNVSTHNSILVKKYGDWDQQHANGAKYTSNSAPTFNQFENFVFDIYVDSANSVLPTMDEFRATFGNLLTDAQYNEMDDGNFHIELLLSAGGNLKASVMFEVGPSNLDKWLRVSVPVMSFDFWELDTSDYSRQERSFSNVQYQSVQEIEVVAETANRNVFRNYVEPDFDANSSPRLFKEEAIRIKLIEFTTAGNDFLDKVVTGTQTQTDTMTDTETSTDTGVSDCSDPMLDFCADFESGSLPNDLQAAGNYQIDSIGYNSASSVKVTANAANFFKVTPPSSDFWARVFIRSNGDSNGSGFGGDDAGFARAHGVLLKGTEGDAQMRVGDHRCQLEINRDGGEGHLGDDLEMTSGNYGDDATVCDESFGARMDVNEWYCLEVHFNGPESEVQVFWDNQNVEQLHVTADRTWTNEDKAPGGQYSMNADQLWGPYNYDYFEFGYESFNNNGAPANTFWYDNVAVSTQKIGCGDDYVQHSVLDDSTKLQPTSNGYPYEGSGNSTPTETQTSTNTDTNVDLGDLGNGEILLYENFESIADNAIPSDWGNMVGYNADRPASEYSISSTSGMGVVSDEQFAGSKSFYATRSSHGGAMQGVIDLNALVSANANVDSISDLYVRLYVKAKEQMTHINGANHAHFLALRGTHADLGDEIRLGEAFGALGFNIVGPDAGDGLFPANFNPTEGPKIDGDVWHCYEVAFLTSGANSQMKVWLDNQVDPVLDVANSSDFHTGTDANYIDDNFNELALGWHSFSGTPSQQAVWIDELVVSTDRIGCP